MDSNPGQPAPGADGIALILQGGGALGAYQGGVYQALHEAGLEPDWVTGVSIGGINSAIIAGNPPERRLERLRAFWDRITDRRIWLFTPDGDDARKARNLYSSMLTITQGQPGFFQPRPANAWFAPRGGPGATSFYDNAPLRQTLLELVDFDLLNARRTRYACGAVNVTTGNFTWFDNERVTIGPEHVMASGALPPALPMARIGEDYFWDGGLVSNTPLQFLLDNIGGMNTLVFQVDLFSARGTLPRDMSEVISRAKDIQYSSRTRTVTDFYARLRRRNAALKRLLDRLPDDLLDDTERYLRAELRMLPSVTILQLVYQQAAYEGEAKDYEFSATSMREHWDTGYRDTKRSLDRRGWLDMAPADEGFVTHDIHREE